MVVTDAQVRKLMKEYTKDGRVGFAAMRAGMDEKTARKYLRSGKLPSELKKPRTWRTREDPFAQHWPEIEVRLGDASDLEAKALFEHLLEQHPETYDIGQLRTFQRRVKQWRATKGPDQEVFFPQNHVPGEALQTDFTHAVELGVTIGGEAFEHLLCHVALPYSNWSWATICRSESMAALKHGLQEAVFRLGCVAEFHQTDNSTAATHNLPSGKRDFNVEYADFIAHLGMKPRTTGVGKKEQNGDIESLHRALKRRLKQYLLLRGSFDFTTLADYETFLADVLMRANGLRKKRFKEDLEAMTPLAVERVPIYAEIDVPVSRACTIRVKYNTYSVPSRLRDERVRVRIYDDRIEVYFGQLLQFETERLQGRSGHSIDYRHVIWSLVKKPGAFQRYRYRDDLFPSVVFRRAYDALAEHLTPRRADLEYLRILHLAASTMESEVEAALLLLLSCSVLTSAKAVQELVAPVKPMIPDMPVFAVDLGAYDGLLSTGVCQ